jgi:hypothetical protein
MIGRRATDAGSPGFVAFILIAAIAAAGAILTWLPPTDFVRKEPVDECINGYVYSWDGKEWHPVYIKKTKRPVPCPGV